MTSIRSEPSRSATDPIFDRAQDRISSLRASARHDHGSTASGTHERRLLERSRDTVGRWLIEFGGALAVDEGLRRRTLGS